MPAPDSPSDEPHPEGSEFLQNPPPEFVEACAARGLDPKATAQRLLELHIQVEREGKELFDDWDQWKPEDRRRFVVTGAASRFSLEEPSGNAGQE